MLDDPVAMVQVGFGDCTMAPLGEGRYDKVLLGNIG